MFVLDSDHLSFLQRQHGPEFDSLSERCSAHQASDFYVTIVSFHEQFNGWTRFIARSQHANHWVRGYRELEGVILTFSRAQVLPFGSAAADIYADLKRQAIRIGSMDLRIASIALANGMTLLTRNTIDFERVPHLQFEDWTVPIR